MRVSREHLTTVPQAVRRYAADTLAQGSNAPACEAVSRRVAAAFDAEFAAATAAGAPIACVPGCVFCCHLRVGVLPHEALALWHYLRTQLPAAEAAEIERVIRANAQRIDELTPAEHRAANIPCAFLRAGRCSAHPVRPSACAAYHSLSRERCEHAFDNPRDAGTPKNRRPALLALQAFGDALIAAARAGLEDAGFASAETELHQSLRALLEGPHNANPSLPEASPCPKSC
ncbi:MAG TPA: YkgJ family cysteine cluster protein [Gammaproteobacteria bacterium]|nr:YkgJ family cysteine cluster protein [Gammaproteobacteria bacterium]